MSQFSTSAGGVLEAILEGEGQGHGVAGGKAVSEESPSRVEVKRLEVEGVRSLIEGLQHGFGSTGIR